MVKLEVDGENPSKSDRIELHCFGAVAERAMRLWQGDLIGIRGRIELRIWTEDGEEYDELRVVAHRIDVMVKGNSDRALRENGNRDRGPRSFGGDSRDRRERGSGQWLRPEETLDNVSTSANLDND